MSSPYLLACLPALTPNCLIQNFDRHDYLSGEDDDFQNEKLLPPPREVFAHEVDKDKSLTTDRVAFEGGFTLLKPVQTSDSLGETIKVDDVYTTNGRVSNSKGIGFGKTDLPGKYGGGLKLSDSTNDLVNTMRREMKDGQLSFRGKRVLELGCGHGLPGIFAVLKGATTVHFQDFDAEVLRTVTVPNVAANLEQARSVTKEDKLDQTPRRTTSNLVQDPSVHYYAGEWGDVSRLLSVTGSDYASDCSADEDLPPAFNSQNEQSNRREGPPPLLRKRSSNSRAFERALFDGPEGGYDIILMSETVYSLRSLPKLYNLIKQVLRPPYGVLYVAAKKHYYGLGGGTRQLKALVDEDGVLGGHLVTDFADGSHVREIWKFFFR